MKGGIHLTLKRQFWFVYFFVTTCFIKVVFCSKLWPTETFEKLYRMKSGCGAFTIWWWFAREIQCSVYNFQTYFSDEGAFFWLDYTCWEAKYGQFLPLKWILPNFGEIKSSKTYCFEECRRVKLVFNYVCKFSSVAESLGHR